MIDTDKYEGHTPAKQWKVLEYCEESLGVFFLAGTTNPNEMYEEECLHCGPQRDGLSQQVFDGRMSEEEVVELCKRDWANQKLMQDAPLLLAEVKRLREAFITAVRHVGEHDRSRDGLFSKLDEDLFSLWLFRSE